MILWELIGSVLVYSNPFPSELSRARGRKRAKTAPSDVPVSIRDVLRTPMLESSKVIMIVSRTGNAKKKAVAGFLRSHFKIFRNVTQ